MKGQIQKVEESLILPDIVVQSQTDAQVELFYRLYPSTPVTQKFMCVVVKSNPNDCFIITAYFTDSIKQGEVLWKKK